MAEHSLASGNHHKIRTSKSVWDFEMTNKTDGHCVKVNRSIGVNLALEFTAEVSIPGREQDDRHL